MPTSLKQHHGRHNYNMGEATYLKVHVYATVAEAQADLPTSVSRIIYVAETQRFYCGRPGTWVGFGTSTTWEDPVQTPDDLPNNAVTGQIRAVLADPAFDDKPSLWQFNGTTWVRITDDARLVFIDGTRKFSGLPGVTDAETLYPSLDTDLTTVKYVSDEIAALAEIYQTAQQVADAISEAIATALEVYSTTEETTQIAADAAAAAATSSMSAHLQTVDPHPQYTTDAEATVIADARAAVVAESRVLTHNANVNAHTDAITNAIETAFVNRVYPGAVATALLAFGTNAFFPLVQVSAGDLVTIGDDIYEFCVPSGQVSDDGHIAVQILTESAGWPAEETHLELIKAINATYASDEHPNITKSGGLPAKANGSTSVTASATTITDNAGLHSYYGVSVKSAYAAGGLPVSGDPDILLDVTSQYIKWTTGNVNMNTLAGHTPPTFQYSSKTTLTVTDEMLVDEVRISFPFEVEEFFVQVRSPEGIIRAPGLDSFKVVEGDIVMHLYGGSDAAILPGDRLIFEAWSDEGSLPPSSSSSSSSS